MDLIFHASYADDEALEAVIESGAVLAPTFTLLGNLADFGEKIGTAPELLSVFRAEMTETARMLSKAHQAGVRLVCGSESGFAITPYGEWHAREMEMLVDYVGLSPLEAITCGTRNGAFAMRMDGQIGTVEAGARADVLVVDGDPIADIRVLQRPEAISEIISRGRRIDLSVPIPERRIGSEEQVRFLAERELTRELAFADGGKVPAGR